MTETRQRALEWFRAQDLRPDDEDMVHPATIEAALTAPELTAEQWDDVLFALTESGELHRDWNQQPIDGSYALRAQAIATAIRTAQEEQ